MPILQMKHLSQQTGDFDPMLAYCRSTVYEDGPISCQHPMFAETVRASTLDFIYQNLTSTDISF